MKIPTEATGLLILLVCIFTIQSLKAQVENNDTTIGDKHFETAKAYIANESYDTAIIYFERASLIYEKHGLWRKYLQCEMECSECYLNLWQLESASNKLKLAVVLALIHIDENDTIVADAYHALGIQYYYLSKLDSTLICWENALRIKQEIFGENHISVANTCNNIGAVYANTDKYDLALEYCFKALHIEQEVLGKENSSVADSYDNIGIIYSYKSEYDLALEYHFIAQKIYIALHEEKHLDVAVNYSNIGNVYAYKSDYNLALEYYIKGLGIKKELLGEENSTVASSYYNIGLCYFKKAEYDLSLEYFTKALQMNIRLLGEKHTDVADIYNVIGNVYTRKHEYNLALKYYFDANQIYKEMLGENHSNVAMVYDNIGVVYNDEQEYDLSLEYFFKSLQIKNELFGEKHPDVAMTYNNIGNAFANMNEYDNALGYFTKSLKIKTEILGEKHADIAMDYFNIGNTYSKKNEYHLALKYYNKGLAASFKDFSDTANIYTIPLIDDYSDWNVVLNILQAKAEIFAGGNPKELSHQDLMDIALRHYQACDTLIGKVRQQMTSKHDKIALGEKASKVYGQAIDVCLGLVETRHALSQKYIDLAFYFSERNKSSVLLESLAAVEAKNFAGIPDSLLEFEHSLSINIASCKQILAEEPDSLSKIKFQDKLFNANRSYDSLITVFESSFPKYYDLKYDRQFATIDEIQKQLVPNTAMISYFTGDSLITIFTLTADNLEVERTAVGKSFDTIVADFCYYGLAYRNNPLRFAKTYKQTAYDLYQKLIPKNLDKKIENLIIIPDGSLGLIPFEALLSDDPGELSWKEMPYLVRKYNISYAYSANLFYKTFYHEPAKEYIQPNLNDWLALAPVFDDAGSAGTTQRTRSMIEDFYASFPDTTSTRGILVNGKTIRPLPGTETEVRAVFEAFDRKNLKATLKTHAHASEEYVKSGELKNYKYLHFATHGFVNTQNPERSGILLAQDTLSTEDCILYSGEIYNLDLNANLVVLSACETALGKISKGEGIIGLASALIYAGTRNLMVSLWEVPDLSTSALMINFYQNLLNDDQQPNISTYLRHAKLEMIDEGTYAHPYYWSPFILIGK